ncbi:MAG: hypothetical protein BJ554DRAFT_1085, partial [Olpidium bornovanus]
MPQIREFPDSNFANLRIFHCRVIIRPVYDVQAFVCGTPAAGRDAISTPCPHGRWFRGSAVVRGRGKQPSSWALCPQGPVSAVTLHFGQLRGNAPGAPSAFPQPARRSSPPARLPTARPSARGDRAAALRTARRCCPPETALCRSRHPHAMAARDSRDGWSGPWRRPPSTENRETELRELRQSGRDAGDKFSTEQLLPPSEQRHAPESGHSWSPRSRKVNDISQHGARSRSTSRWRAKRGPRPASSLDELYADVKFNSQEGRTIMLWRERDVALFNAMCDFVKDKDVDLLSLVELFGEDPPRLPHSPPAMTPPFDVREFFMLVYARKADHENSDAVAKLVLGSARYDYIFKHPAPPERFTVGTRSHTNDTDGLSSLSEEDYRKLEERAEFEQHLLDIGLFLEREEDIDGENCDGLKLTPPFCALESQAPSDVLLGYQPIMSFFISAFGHRLDNRNDTAYFRVERLHEFVNGDPSDPVIHARHCPPPVPRRESDSDQSSAQPRGESYVRLNFFSTGRRSLLAYSM